MYKVLSSLLRGGCVVALRSSYCWMIKYQNEFDGKIMKIFLLLLKNKQCSEVNVLIDSSLIRNKID